MKDAASFTVTQIWRYPVKSMGGELIDEGSVGERGIHLDRGWAIRDEKLGAIRSARYIPRILMCTARYLHGTNAGLVPHVEITLPDGETVNSDDSQVNRKLSDAIGKHVSLLSLRAPDDVDLLKKSPDGYVTGSFETELRLMFGLAPGDPLPDRSRMPTKISQELSELSAPAGTFFDAFPLSVMTTSTIRVLQQYAPDVDLDVRRFRPNILLDNGRDDAAMHESAWVEQKIKLGTVELNVVMEIARCIMIAAQQPNLSKASVLNRAVIKEMRQMMGVYCQIGREGKVRLGDELHIMASA